MTGHFDNEIQGEPILWADASLNGIDAGYEELAISVREDIGISKTIRCLGYIGFQMVGYWDEVIIESSSLYSSHAFITECELRLQHMPESGCAARVANKNMLLEIILIDGCKLWVCASQFRCESARSG